MAKLPYMRLYVNDLFGDTQTLSDGEFGSYVAIIMAMWKSGGWLTADQARKASRVRGGGWPKRWASLAGYFEIEADGRITHARVREDLADIGRLDEGRSKGVSAEVQKVASADDTSVETNPLKNNKPASDPLRALAQRHSAASEGRESERVVPFPLAQQPARENDWPHTSVSDLLDALAKRLAHPWFDPSKDVTMKLRSSAATYFARWREAGCSWDADVVPTAEALCVTAGRLVMTLKFFDGAVLDAQRARTAPHQSRAPQEARHDQKLADKNLNLVGSHAAADRVHQRKLAGEPGCFGDD